MAYNIPIVRNESEHDNGTQCFPETISHMKANSVVKEIEISRKQDYTYMIHQLM